MLLQVLCTRRLQFVTTSEGGTNTPFVPQTRHKVRGILQPIGSPGAQGWWVRLLRSALGCQIRLGPLVFVILE